MNDRFELERFVAAQDPVWDQVRREMAAGRKRSHWIWFVFPQMTGLGSSAMSRRYAIGSIEEADAFLAHPILGARLVSLTAVVNAIEGRSAADIFGSPDDLKFHSSMTLFGRVQGADPAFRIGLKRFFDGLEDAATINALA